MVQRHDNKWQAQRQNKKAEEAGSGSRIYILKATPSDTLPPVRPHFLMVPNITTKGNQVLKCLRV